MAYIVGSAGNDVMVGTTEADRMEGGAGNDRLNAGAGDDEIFGGEGADTLTGDAGNDSIFGGAGNDGVYGGGGNDSIDGGEGDDVLFGDGGNDVMTGGKGNDRLTGGTGDDTFIYHAGDGSDIIVGGQGNDRLELVLTSADVTEALGADLAAYQVWAANQLAAAGSQANLVAQTTGETFTFASLGLTISALEGVTVVVDGQVVAIDDLLNAAPAAAAEASFAVAEDTVLEGEIVASDANGDVLSYVVESGPANGTLSLDSASGRFVYTPAGNFSGSDSFSVRVSDPDGASVVQTVNVGIAAVADEAILSTKDVVVSLGRPVITGTKGNDNLRGDQPVANATVSLAIAAALQDVDGSETSSVRIDGLPPHDTLSAGVRNNDGSWTLTADDLAGLTMTASTAQPITLEVTATTMEQSGDSASVTKVLQVTFDHGSNDDTFLASYGNDTYDGGTGFDTVDYSSIGTAVDVDLADTSASGPGRQTLRSIEGVVGTAYNDRIVGNSEGNVIEAGAGNDRVDGGAGNDLLIDGAGNDRYDGGRGNDVMFDGAGDDRYDGDSGFDTLDYSNATRAVVIDNDRDTVTGMGNDRFDSIEKIVGSAFADTYYGSRNDDIFDGGAGNDWIRGYQGSDIFTGGAGHDTFVWLEKDVASGRKSQGVDRITDFSAGDALDLSAFTDGSANDVRVTNTAHGTMVSVKVGRDVFDVVLLENVHDVTVGSLLADGSLIV